MHPHRNDHFMITMADDPKASTGKTLRITRPTDVLSIFDKEELQLQLKHYSRPFLRHLVPDSTFARKHYILYTRPALRYFCAKFNVTVPDWLKDDSYYEHLPPDELESLFGTTKLRWNGEFRAPPTRGTRGKVHQ